jgi:hypothetical protein
MLEKEPALADVDSPGQARYCCHEAKAEDGTVPFAVANGLLARQTRVFVFYI